VADRDDAEEKRKKERRRDARDTAADVAGDGLEAAGEGCLGCDLHFVIALTLVAGVPLLIWSL